MPLLVFSGLDSQLQLQERSFGSSEIDVCFEALSNLVKKGWQLQRLELIIDQTRVSLPIEAFDGYSMAAPLAALQGEWKTLLATIEPGKPSAINSLVCQRIQKRINQQQKMLTGYQDSIARLNRLVNKAQQTLKNTPVSSSS